MEIIGLAVGIPGLFSACMDILERFEDYKNFGMESRHLIAQFEALKFRLKKWAIRVGMPDGKRTKMYDARIQDDHLALVITRVLESVSEIFDATERTRSRLPVDAEETNTSFPDMPGFSMKTTKNKKKRSVSTSIRGGLDWACKRRGKFSYQIEMFRQHVEMLDDLVPISTDEPSPISTNKLSLDQSVSASFDKTIQILIDDKQRLTLERANTAINGWLDITKCDKQDYVDHDYETQKSLRLEGTCEWIFSKPTYCTWASEDFFDGKPKFLWIYGPPGFGKTVLCARLVEHFKEKLALPIAYFFSSAHAQSGGRLSAIVRTWIGQIAQADSDALDLVRGYCERSEAGRVASETEIWSVFESIISDELHYTFAIDGFDEYAGLDEARSKFLRRLKQATEGTSTRILISSREETVIRSELFSESSQSAGLITLECKISKEDVRDDNMLYSRSVLDENLAKKNEAFRQDLTNQLVEKCEGMFLWIKLLKVQLRRSKNDKQLQNIVKNMPSELNQTYERNWKTIQSRPVNDRKRALAILRWATFAFQPLTVLDMTEALVVEIKDGSGSPQWDELPDIIDDDYIIDEIVDICACLLEVRVENPRLSAGSRTIHLIHPSVREFLLSVLSPNPELILDPFVLSDQAIDQSGHQNYLATICLVYLSHGAARQTSDSDYRTPCHYAAHHWWLHINAADRDDDRVIRLVNKFLCPENVNFELWRNSCRAWSDVRDEDYDEAKAVVTPLHYTALCNLIPSMEFILRQRTADLNSVHYRSGTPLHAACIEGHPLAVDTLLRWGADPNLQAGRARSALNGAVIRGHIDIVKSLANIGVSLEVPYPRGRTPLCLASLNNYPAIVDFLLDAGAKLETKDEDGLTPLIIAAGQGHLEVVKLLLDRGADVSMSDHEGSNSMLYAAGSGHVEVIKLLLDRGADITMSNNQGGISMHWAVANGHLEVVKLLLDRGADVSMSDHEGSNSMHWAASKGQVEVIKLLLDRGTDITMSDNQGRTSMHWAALGGHLEVVKLLLDRGADVFISDHEGSDSMLFAAAKGHVEVVKLLLDRRADTTLSNNHGETPMHQAACWGHIEVVKLLLDRGVDFMINNDKKGSPLHQAAFKGHFKVAELLLNRGADIMNSVKGYTPIHSAAAEGHVEIVKLLLDRGADVMLNNDGRTPLHADRGAHVITNSEVSTPLFLAAEKGHVEVVKLLLDRGADVMLNNDGRIPLHAAAFGVHLEIVELLLNRGAHVITNSEVSTPLFLAAKKGHVEVVELLLDRRAGDMTNDKILTLVDVAAHEGQLEVVQLLLNRGGSVLGSCHTEEEMFVSRFDVNLHGGPHGSMLNTAAYRGHLEFLQVLVKNYNADIMATDILGRTPLHVAARGGNIGCVDYLLGNGLRCSDVDKVGNNVLHYACSGGSIQVVRKILELDPLTVESSTSWTPLHWACRTGGYELIHLLLSRGVQDSIVRTTHPSGRWTSASIGIFHQNPYLKPGVSDLSNAGSSRSVKSSSNLQGTGHGGVTCDSCFHGIYGRRFKCRECDDFDFCFMCRLTSEKTHPGHSWQEHDVGRLSTGDDLFTFSPNGLQEGSLTRRNQSDDSQDIALLTRQ